MGVARGSQKEKAKSPSDKSSSKSFEIPRKAVTPEKKASQPAKQATAVKQASQPTSTSAASTKTAAKASTPQKTAQTTPKDQKAQKTPVSKKETAPKAAISSPSTPSAPQPKPQATKPEPKPAAKPKPQPVVEKAVEKKETARPESVMSKPQAEGIKPEPAQKPQPQPVLPQKEQHDLKKSEERVEQQSTNKAPAPEAPSKTADLQTTAAADIDILVDKAVAEELDDLGELVRPFDHVDSKSLPVDQGPDLNVGAPVGASSASSISSTTEQDEKAAAEAQTPAPVTSTPSSATSTPSSAPSKPAKPASKQSPAEAFVEFSKRAAALRDQGAYAIAALLYEEAASLAPTVNDMRNTQFDELACYVKAGDTNKAKALASKLRQSSVLTRFERIKLDAVERMG